MASNDKAAQLLARYPGPVTLYPSRRKWLLVLAGGLAFTVGGIMMVRSGDVTGWFVIAFFGLGSIIALAAMLPGAGSLTFDRDGFAAKTLFRGHRARWADATGFIAVGIPPSMQRMVCYDDASVTSSALASANVAITGRNAALNDTFGLSADDLAQLMIGWRERALARSYQLTPGASRPGAHPQP
jgi:hypothetical protein